jgi:chromosome partitioning protein
MQRAGANANLPPIAYGHAKSVHACDDHFERRFMLANVTMDMLSKVADEASNVLHQIRKILAIPHPKKSAPLFSSNYIADLCKIDKTQMRYLAEKHKLPQGSKKAGSKAKEYTLEETIQWSTTLGNWATRPGHCDGRCIAVVNYKGGVTKTSTAVSLAQGLTLRGLKVLIVDLDGQGTATQMCGLSPDENVDLEDTIMPFIDEDQPDLKYAVQESYWSNLSIIPANSRVLGADFSLPMKMVKGRNVKFWNFLSAGLRPLRNQFDVIILDTSPSLSYMTMNAMFAADGLIMPCPPESFDFASSVQFWDLFGELTRNFKEGAKVFEFVTVVLAKTKSTDSHRLVKQWMVQAYQGILNQIEIPDSDAARMAAAQLKTIYDLERPDGSVSSYRRYKEPMDAMCDQVLNQLAVAWSKV